MAEVKKPTVKDRVLSLLQSKEWLSAEDFEREFPPKTDGHLSWGQRLRELRTEGYTIEPRIKADCKHTWEYHLVPKELADTEQESAIRHNNFIQEQAINFKAVGKQLQFI